MNYRLKDKGLQVQLDAISDGDFSRQLEANRGAVVMGIEYSEQATLWFCKTGGPLLSIEITPDMIEKVSEYDPHGWNSFPEVEPPEGVWMRCETDVNAIEHKIRHVAKFDGREWREYLSKQVVLHRFRPWDNPENDE